MNTQECIAILARLEGVAKGDVSINDENEALHYARLIVEERERQGAAQTPHGLTLTVQPSVVAAMTPTEQEQFWPAYAEIVTLICKIRVRLEEARKGAP